jgi:hypothetical protein
VSGLVVFAPRPVHDLLPPAAGDDTVIDPGPIVVVGTICIGCHERDGAHATTLAGRPCPFRIGGPMDGGGQQDRYGRERGRR